MRRITRIYHICFLFLFLCVNAMGCTNTQTRENRIETKNTSIRKEENAILKGNYGDTQSLIKDAMRKIDTRISVLEEVQVVSETKDEGMYTYANYQIQSILNTILGIENASLLLQVKKIDSPLLEKSEYHFDVHLEDREPPQIVLKEEHITILEGQEVNFEEYIENISDNLDEQFSEVKITSSLVKENDKWMLGKYEVCYSVQDQHQNETSKILQVHVVEDEVPRGELVMANLPNTHMSNLAQSLIGKAYSWGGKGPETFDCSGIIMYVYSCLQEQISWAQVQYGIGTPISLDSSFWQEGDVLSYRDNSGEIVHHALYLGNGLALHAMVDGVRIVSIHTQMESGPNNPQRIVRVTRYI